MEKLGEIKEDLQSIIEYPPKGHKLRTEDGYPFEIIYDRFAYKRMVDSYRKAVREVLRKMEEVEWEAERKFLKW